MANNSNTSVQFVYKRVIEETIKSSRETFLNEGIEDSVLQELKMLWERKVQASSALEPSNPPDYMPHHRHMHMPQNHGFVMGRPPQTLLARQPIAARPANIGSQAGSSSSTFTVPFPSLSGVCTATKEEYNKGSDSIQVDGCSDHILEDCAATSPTERGSNKVALEKKKKRRSVYLPDLSGEEAKAQLKRTLLKNGSVVIQVDGGLDSDDDAGEFVDSDESEDEEDEDDGTDEDVDVGGDGEGGNGIDVPIEEEEDPLNSEDDESDEDGEEHLKTDNVIVCLFDKVTRSKNKWKLYLKDGVMHIKGKDHVFQKAIGDGEF